MVTEKKRENTDEVEAAKNEPDLKQENEALTRELKSRDAAITRLEQTLAGKDELEIAAANNAGTSLHKQTQSNRVLQIVQFSPRDKADIQNAFKFLMI